MSKEEEKQEEVVELETVDLPVSLIALINLSNESLQRYQQKLFADIEVAAADSMKIMGLDPAVGWRLDLSQQKFVKYE